MHEDKPNYMMLISSDVLDQKIRLAFAEGKRAGVDAAIFVLNSVSGQASLDKVLETIEAIKLT